MALMELVLNSTYGGQKFVNRFNFLSSGTPAAVSLSFALVSAFGAIFDTVAIPPAYPPGTLLDFIRASSSAGLQFANVLAKDVYSVTDFYDTSLVPTLIGGIGGDGESPVMAMGYTTNRTRSDIRRGQKRFGGVPSSAVDSQGSFSSGHKTLMDDVAEAMSEPLIYDDEGAALSFAPVVVGREKYAVPDTSPVRYAYKYYDTLIEQLDHVATSVIWSPYAQERSQTSRQFGRGS